MYAKKYQIKKSKIKCENVKKGKCSIFYLKFTKHGSILCMWPIPLLLFDSFFWYIGQLLTNSIAYKYLYIYKVGELYTHPLYWLWLDLLVYVSSLDWQFRTDSTELHYQASILWWMLCLVLMYACLYWSIGNHLLVIVQCTWNIFLKHYQSYMLIIYYCCLSVSKAVEW